jgi:hypothetical protein
VHVVAYFVFGMLGAALVVELWAAVTSLSWNTIQFIADSGSAPLTVFIILTAGVAGAAAWLHAWRMAVRRDARRASNMGLAA